MLDKPPTVTAALTLPTAGTLGGDALPESPWRVPAAGTPVIAAGTLAHGVTNAPAPVLCARAGEESREVA